ncbi:cupin domain-containing protein [Acetobacter estunensis]|nr:cupin domain-containing protein [Acetobacter estunensis]MBV1835774.1 cupin domain-containing protein [Acetobacter estunensis]MBV1835965.1 cupin domain-containing protein [Acetobacter estunensis]
MHAARFLSAATVVGMMIAAGTLHAQNVATAHKDVLLQSDHSWNGVAYKPYSSGQPQLTMIRLTIPAHTALPWHTHPCPNAGYVLEGQLTITDRESGKQHTFHKGEAFAESVDDIHRGQSGDTQTVLLLTYAGEVGQPTSVPVKGEKPEY